MDTLRVGGSSFVFGEHNTNKVFTSLEFDENYQKLELILDFNSLSCSNPHCTVPLTPPCLTYPICPPLPNPFLPSVLPHPLNPHPTSPILSLTQLKGGNHYLEQSAYLPEHIFISSDSQRILKNINSIQISFV